MSNTPVALFVRVSTKSQSYDRQIADLTAVAQRQAYQVIQVISETGSATKRRNVDRPEIELLLELCRSGSIKKVLVSEFSRLGRRRGETARLLEEITDLGVSVYAHNLGMETLQSNGSGTSLRRNPVASIVLAVMTEIDAMETERLSERISSGLDQARRQGKTLGRPQGSTLADQALLQKYPGVVKDIKSGLSIRQVAAIRGVSKDTVERVKRASLKS